MSDSRVGSVVAGGANPPGTKYDMWVSGADIMLANKYFRQHWSKRDTKTWREFGYWEAQRRSIPKNLPPCEILSRAIYPTSKKGKLPDTTSWYPTTKAIIDGLVDWGCWPDDTPEWVTFEGFWGAVRSADVSVPLIRLQLVVI